MNGLRQECGAGAGAIDFIASSAPLVKTNHFFMC